jgi:hypothetical protein
MALCRYAVTLQFGHHRRHVLGPAYQRDARTADVRAVAGMRRAPPRSLQLVEDPNRPLRFGQCRERCARSKLYGVEATIASGPIVPSMV